MSDRVNSRHCELASQGYSKKSSRNHTHIIKENRRAFRTLFDVYNLGQKVGNKFTNLSKISFSMEWFTAGFLQFFTKKRQNLDFGWTAVHLPSNLTISEIFLKFLNFLRS